jgi:hypothetical protein
VPLALLAAFAMAYASPASARHHTPTAKQRIAERQKLLRVLHRNPSAVRQAWFLRRAGLFGIDLPVTIRLTPAVDSSGSPAALDDDGFQIDLGTDPSSPPLPSGDAAGVVASTLKGNFSSSLRFGQDSAGYGQLGTIELGFGAMAMTASGFDLVRDPATPCALASTASTVAITESPGSGGSANFFTNTFEINLHTAFSFASQTRSLCTDPFATTALMPGTGRATLPIRIKGSFRVSPALTADGRVRLGRMTLAGTQKDSFVQVHTCTGPPPPATCAAGAPDEATLPGRLLATAFNAEMLVGNVL